MKLSDYAKLKSVTYRTAWSHYKQGKIKGAEKDSTGHIYINETVLKNIDMTKACIYCRVSSNKQKNDLVRQVDRVKSFAITNGYTIEQLIKEVGSGVNDNRKGLIKVLQDSSWNTLIVEHKDRLTRFGFNYIKILLEVNHKHILVINKSEDSTNDLMQDMISVLYSFSARMYGKGRTKKSKIKKILEDLV